MDFTRSVSLGEGHYNHAHDAIAIEIKTSFGFDVSADNQMVLLE